jgi:hypothetical protein
MKRVALSLAVFLAGFAAGQWHWTEPRAAWAVGSPVGHTIKDEAKPISLTETAKIEAHLRRVLGNPAIRLDRQPPEAEVFIGKEFIGIVYPDESDGERAFYFEMAILGSDLEPDTLKDSRKGSRR